MGLVPSLFPVSVLKTMNAMNDMHVFSPSTPAALDLLWRTNLTRLEYITSLKGCVNIHPEVSRNLVITSPSSRVLQSVPPPGSLQPKDEISFRIHPRRNSTSAGCDKEKGGGTEEGGGRRAVGKRTNGSEENALHSHTVWISFGR